MNIESSIEPLHDRARTKIVATLGPASTEPQMIERLIFAGADVFRLNMAHGTMQEHGETIKRIRRLSQDAGRPVGILVDLAGPKIRLGELLQDPLDCPRDAVFRFVRGDAIASGDQLTSSYGALIDELQTDDRVLLADGTVEMTVIRKERDEIHCRVTQAGVVRSRQGINLPGAKLSVPAMDDDDMAHAEWAARSEVDFVSLSFVRSPVEIRRLKEIIHRQNSTALVIAKIEKPEALDALDEIVEASDGIMVARGDLGVEIDVAEMPVAQKRIISTCTRLCRPVIVATQMLDSMQRNSRPTRAEATDVANAILDGADACMLSGETAIGRFPFESVKTMNRIMVATERILESDRRSNAVQTSQNNVHAITAAVVNSSGRIAADLDAKMVVVATKSGATALVKAKQRDFVRTVTVSHCQETLRKTTLFWGIEPLATTASAESDGELIEFVEHWGRTNGCLQSGDRIVLLNGSGLRANVHNSLIVHEME